MSATRGVLHHFGRQNSKITHFFTTTASLDHPKSTKQTNKSTNIKSSIAIDSAEYFHLLPALRYCFAFCSTQFTVHYTLLFRCCVCVFLLVVRVSVKGLLCLIRCWCLSRQMHGICCICRWRGSLCLIVLDGAAPLCLIVDGWRGCCSTSRTTKRQQAAIKHKKQQAIT